MMTQWWDTLQVRFTQAPFTFNLNQQTDWTDYVSLGVAIVGMLVTVALASFAWVEMNSAKAATQRAEDAEKAREKAAARRVSAISFAVRRQIISWLVECPPTDQPPGYAPPPTDNAWERHIETHYDAAEQRFTALMLAAGEAPPAVTEAIYAAFVKFYRAAEIVNRLRQLQNARHKQDTPLEIRRSIKNLLLQCRDHLTEVIDAELKGAEQSLTAIPSAFPWGFRQEAPHLRPPPAE